MWKRLHFHSLPALPRAVFLPSQPLAALDPVARIMHSGCRIEQTGYTCRLLDNGARMPGPGLEVQFWILHLRVGIWETGSSILGSGHSISIPGHSILGIWVQGTISEQNQQYLLN